LQRVAVFSYALLSSAYAINNVHILSKIL